ncbi:nucleoside deaminase [Chitinophaga sp. Mgbs1]|uniref:Nucleoside deaminase n=1 Tax=Chitinophaga solisilvae TaxID=1233460 RepID=A0A3S1D3K2_9BACT|nr:nucleoside deaminase [Chitinophaga solisilvae]
MHRCLELAEIAASQGESPVGSVIVKNGIIIGEAYEQSKQLQDITRHAETLALLDALHKGTHPAGATMYTNVEPCLLCSYAIRHYRIAAVVFMKHAGELGGTREPFNILTTDKVQAWGAAPEIHIM